MAGCRRLGDRSKCKVLAISAAASPRAPAWTIASAVDTPSGEKNKFPLASRSFPYRSKARRLLPATMLAASGSVTEDTSALGTAGAQAASAITGGNANKEKRMELPVRMKDKLSQGT